MSGKLFYVAYAHEDAACGTTILGYLEWESEAIDLVKKLNEHSFGDRYYWDEINFIADPEVLIEEERND